eukprot:TRINITY_DN11408_c0_g2_i1.p1 TRINITY_DN11408_c0_g2~~TRINITY_DN11408_c0_g2_i1.p1  ORF type:complete len:361 (-),score=47.41 TRINITY_DN11408_c0_g2_i1:58-1140(-)
MIVRVLRITSLLQSCVSVLGQQPPPGPVPSAASVQQEFVQPSSVSLDAIHESIENGCLKNDPEKAKACTTMVECKDGELTSCANSTCSCQPGSCFVSTICVSSQDLAAIMHRNLASRQVFAPHPVEINFRVGKSGDVEVSEHEGRLSDRCNPLEARPFTLTFQKADEQQLFQVTMMKKQSCDKVGFRVTNSGSVQVVPNWDLSNPSMTHIHNADGPYPWMQIWSGDKLLQVCILTPQRCSQKVKMFQRFVRYQDILGTFGTEWDPPNPDTWCPEHEGDPEDQSQKNSMGEGCGWYTRNAQKLGAAAVCTGAYDTPTFVARSACCVCRAAMRSTMMGDSRRRRKGDGFSDDDDDNMNNMGF